MSGTSASNVWTVGVSSGRAAVGGARPGFAAAAAGLTRESDFAGPARRLVPLILHWNGTAWQRARVPASQGGELIGVFAASGRSAWAVGTSKSFANPKSKPVVLRWNGRAWK